MGGPGGQSRHFEEEAWYQGSKDRKQFEVTGKIMLSAIVILFAVIVLMVGLHIYARWYLNRARRRHLSRRRRRTHVIFNVDAAATNLAEPPGRGLDASVLSSLPLFTYSPESHPEAPLECAVCLSEFEEKETCRRLPKCDHSFHVGCIDMWFHSHSTCPLCRAPVDDEAPVPDRLPPRQDHVAISVAAEPAESEAATTAPSTSQHGVSTSKLNNDDSTTPSLRRKAAGLVVGVSIEVPGRNAAVFLRSEDQSGAGFHSPAFKSPGGRIRSFTRIISRDHIRAAEALTSPTSAPSCSSVPSEADLERGQSEETQQTRAQTPR